MAFQISITNPIDGAILPNAYARVGAVTIDVINQRAGASVSIYKDAEARQSERQPVIVESYLWEEMGAPEYVELFGATIPARPSFEEAFGAASRDAVNVIGRAYVVLKTYLPAYATAIDI